MRRKDREVFSDEIFLIIDQCSVIRLAMVDDGMPYLVALNFGYERNSDEIIFYFHSAKEGKKIEILKKNPKIYFEMDSEHKLWIPEDGKPCSYSWQYASVMGQGEVQFIDSLEEKTHAFNQLISHLTNQSANYDYSDEMIQATCVFKVVTKEYTGKRRG